MHFLLRFSGFLTFTLVLIIGLTQSLSPNQSRQQLLKKYHEADRLFNEGENIVNRKDYTEEKEKKLNNDALASFKNLQTKLREIDPGFDSLSFFINFKIGILEHYFDNFTEAKKSYSNAIDLRAKLPVLADSFFFKPYLYFGIILYNEDLFDSSLSTYKKAERIAQSYSSPLQETERLYNTLGALYYETGNYRQAKNYIEKSLAGIPRSNPYYKELVVNYKINLASILTKLEEYDEANRIYQEVLPLNINHDIALHNLGVIDMKLGAGKKALEYFRKVNYTDDRRSRLYNDMAEAFMNINLNDSAAFYLQKAEKLDTKVTRKSVVKGQTDQLWGNLLLSENKIQDALVKFQFAITQYYPAYSETDIYKNPTSFSGVFSYINLFNTLTLKAEALEKLYQKKKDVTLLIAALDAYSSAFKLADYVEKSYDSDEARIFLSKIKYKVHSSPIDISIFLYEITKDENYLEQAWQFDQMNKASILSYNIYENELRKNDSVKSTASNERALKSAITRLSLKAAKENDTDKLKEINNAIRDYEIGLGKIQDSITAINNNKNVKPAIHSAKWLQQNLLDNKTAILSYHLSEKELLILYFNKKDFKYKKTPVDQTFYSTIDSFIRALHSVSGENKFEARNISQRLYAWLISPADNIIQNSNRLVIIPDDELNYIPFEALQDPAGNYLTQKFSVQYQYSASLLEKRKRKLAPAGILSFAPFANSASNKLSYSIEEIKDLPGQQYFDKEATKEKFLGQANKLAVIHLATHAQVNDSKPLQSFIAFAENNSDSAESRLYAQEIYDLSLDSTELIILSACETGSGQLVHGEGMMSLSRAFAYAGCPDIIASLWKAEDKTTAFLTRRLHFYLANKKTTEDALHLAKLDLLNSNEIDERFKTPNYWAHIIFIGEYEPNPSSVRFKWWFVIPILFYFIGWLIYKKKIIRTRSKSI